VAVRTAFRLKNNSGQVTAYPLRGLQPRAGSRPWFEKFSFSSLLLFFLLAAFIFRSIGLRAWMGDICGNIVFGLGAFFTRTPLI
jgi:hypothetical protein